MEVNLTRGSVSKPFASTHPHAGSRDKFPSALFLNFAQAIASALFAAVYLTIGSWRDGTLTGKGLKGVLGIDQLRVQVPAEDSLSTKTGKKVNGTSSESKATNRNVHANGNGNGNGNGIDHIEIPTEANGGEKKTITPATPWTKTLPVLLFQVSLFQTMAGPIGFSALRHISYPTMVLGKVSKGYTDEIVLRY